MSHLVLPFSVSGYLCLFMEKDELLGTTLILAWVPNSRIQRQDEEALRYVTPESSPVRKAPRRRGRLAQGLATGQPASPPEHRGALSLRGDEILTVSQLLRDGAASSEGEKLSQSGARRSPQPPRSDSGTLSTVSSQEEHNRSEGTEEGPDCREDEGSLELSADDVSRDSTFDSDSDAFSSPFCLSPISEALGKSSSSVFLDSESRWVHPLSGFWVLSLDMLKEVEKLDSGVELNVLSCFRLLWNLQETVTQFCFCSVNPGPKHPGLWMFFQVNCLEPWKQHC